MWDQAERKSVAIGSNMETHESCENNIGKAGQSIWDQTKGQHPEEIGDKIIGTLFGRLGEQIPKNSQNLQHFQVPQP